MARYYVYMVYAPQGELPFNPEHYGLVEEVPTHDPDHPIVITTKPLDINWPHEKIGEYDTLEEARSAAEEAAG